MATLTEVAERAGVSVSVVSRVLNGDPTLRIKPETRERVMDAAREFSYVPHHAARSLRLSRTRSLALIVPDVTNPITGAIVIGVEDAAARHGYSTVLGRSEWFSAHPDALNRLMSEGRVDGLLFARVETATDEELQHLLVGSAPTILLNTRHPGLRGSVVLDDAAASKLATQHLIDLGHRSIGLVTGSPGNEGALRRERGYRAAMQEAGIVVKPTRVLRHGYSPDAGAEGLRRLLDDRPTAVFAANLNAAIGALTAAHDLGLRVPDDVSLIGLHDSWFAAHTSPPLTTVRTALYELGQTGVEQLLLRLDGEAPQDVVVAEPAPQVVERGTTAPVG